MRKGCFCKNQMLTTGVGVLVVHKRMQGSRPQSMFDASNPKAGTAPSGTLKFLISPLTRRHDLSCTYYETALKLPRQQQGCPCQFDPQRSRKGIHQQVRAGGGLPDWLRKAAYG